MPQVAFPGASRSFFLVGKLRGMCTLSAHIWRQQGITGDNVLNGTRAFPIPLDSDECSGPIIQPGYSELSLCLTWPRKTAMVYRDLEIIMAPIGVAQKD